MKSWTRDFQDLPKNAGRHGDKLLAEGHHVDELEVCDEK